MCSIMITEYQLELMLKCLKCSCCKLHFANVLEILWESFSDIQKQKWDSYRFCTNHYNSCDGDMFEGPLPIKRNCSMCKRE